jgi:nucleoside-diphosphate-sugar epimerase
VTSTVLVTGALGHIGSSLIRRLPTLLPGVRIRMLDNLSTQRYCSLFNLPPEGQYEFVEGDILGEKLRDAVAGCSAVVHLAGLTDATGTAGTPELVMRANRDGAHQVALACAAAGVPMLLASTTSIYGSQAATVDESCPDSELKPQSPYAESKLAAERLLADLGASHGLRWTACRFGTIFGTSPGMRFHTAVNKFVWQACTGLPITVWRTALDQKRPYLDISDAVDAIAFILRTDLFPGEMFNVVTCNATVREITDEIRRSVPSLTIEFVDTQIMNQLSYHVLAERIQAKGFRFAGNLERSIAESVQQLRVAGGNR